MSVTVVQERFDSYQCSSAIEETHARREITQELILAGLARTDFFKHADFHGGTCLRIVHSLNRYSEDLDFALKEPDMGFVLEPYLQAVANELKAFGYDLEIQDRSSTDTAVKKAFLKDDSTGRILTMRHTRQDRSLPKLRVKLEVDANPPAAARTERKFLDFPYPTSVAVHDLPTLFSGKMYALLCRQYVKGRDWYDFNWYVSRKVDLNLEHLSKALDQAGPWLGAARCWTHPEVCDELQNKVAAIDWETARKDVERFVRPIELPSLDLWGFDYFVDRVDRLRQFRAC